MTWTKRRRSIRIVWTVISILVALSMVLFLIAPFFGYY